MNDSEKDELKCILLGESGVGKTCLIIALIGLGFNPNEISSISSSYVTKKIIIGDKSYKVNLWDTIGQEEYHSLTKIFIKNSQLVFFVYDITNRKSFEKLDFWYNTTMEVLGEDAVTGFIGNKEDLYIKEEEKEEEIEKYAQEKKAPFKYTSALTPSSFEIFLQKQVEAYIKKTEGIVENVEGKKLNIKKDKKSKKWC